MFWNNLYFELLAFQRDRWVLLVIVLFFGFTFFALRNGQQAVIERQNAINKEVQHMDSLDAARVAKIIAYENDPTIVQAEYDPRDPRDLWGMSYTTPRVVSMPPQPLSLVAIGQSDLFPHVVKPKIYTESYRLGFSELTNPVQLLFGTFDFAFVCIYLLPLLVFASSYNVLSGDKELGILSLTASQPISLYKWLLHKLLIRLLLLSLIVAVAYLIGLGILGINITSNLASVLKLLVPIIIYMGFWFGLAFVVNLMGRPSGTNAITLVALWLVIVLLIPAVISQTINTLHPVPSRVKIIHEYREAYSDALKNIDKIMGVYLRDHPELAAQNESVESRYGFMLRTFASASVINQAIDPVLTGYNEALKKQQARVNQMMLLSPALLLQKVFSQTAGTTASHYADFQQQIIDFTETWKDYLKPRMFANELLRSEDFSSFPRYQYSDEQVPDTIGRLTFLLGFFLLLIGAISIWIYKKKKTQLVVN